MTIDSVRTLLFVPGNRPERFAKALESGADAVCIDLEDAVAPDAKSAARQQVMTYLATRPARAAALGVRINSIRSLDGLRDLACLADQAARPDFLMLPKCAHESELSILADCFADMPLWPIVESAAGLRAAFAIAAAPNVAGILFGAVDFAAEMGCTLDWEPLAHARGTLAAARASAGIQLLDVPSLDVRDMAALEAGTRRAQACGFTGRACIHPAQVAIVNLVFTPSAADIAHAQRLIAALQAASGDAALLDGKLIEKPVILAAERILARAGRA